MKAKVIATGKVVNIHACQTSQDGNSIIKLCSDAADGFNVYEIKDLLLIFHDDEPKAPAVDEPQNLSVKEWQQRFERLYEQAEKDLGQISEITLRPYRMSLNDNFNTAISCASTGKTYLRRIGSKIEFDDSEF